MNKLMEDLRGILETFAILFSVLLFFCWACSFGGLLTIEYYQDLGYGNYHWYVIGVDFVVIVLFIKYRYFNH